MSPGGEMKSEGTAKDALTGKPDFAITFYRNGVCLARGQSIWLCA